MKIEDKILKRIAEAYVVENKTLSKSEFELLKNSKYKNLLKEETFKTRFSNLFESAVQGKEIEKKQTPVRKLFGHSIYFNLNTSRHTISDLIDEIEEHFGIGIENEKLGKYDDVDLDDLKDFIKLYLVKAKKEHTETFRRIHNANVRARSVRSLLLHLRSMTI
jgi:hypothetical protein